MISQAFLRAVALFGLFVSTDLMAQERAPVVPTTTPAPKTVINWRQEENLSFECLYCDIHVFEREGEQMVLEKKNPRTASAPLVYKREGKNHLVTFSDDEGSTGGTTGVNERVEIYLPARRPVNLKLSTVSGKVILKDIRVKALTLDTVSGSVEWVNLVGAKVKIKTTSGSLKGVGQIDQGEFESTSGDLAISLKYHLENIRMSTQSGDISLELGKALYVQVEAKTSTGEIKVPLVPNFKGTSFNQTLGPKTKGSAAKLALKSVSGSLLIKESEY